MSKDDVEINAAIDRVYANGGGEVQLTEGTFYIDEPICLKSNISLVGRGMGTIIVQQTSTQDVIKIVGTTGSHIVNVSVRNIKAMRPTASVLTNGYRAIYAEYADGLIIDNFYSMYMTGHAIRLLSVTMAEISKNIFNNVLRDNAISISKSSQIILSNNTIVSCANSIEVASSVSVIISSNNIKNSWATGGSGIYISQSDVSIIGNKIDFVNWDGIFLYKTTSCVINNNTLTSCGHYGIWLQGTTTVGCNYTSIIGNNVQNGGSVGIFIAYGSSNSILDNIAINNSTNFTDSGTLTTSKGNNFT